MRQRRNMKGTSDADLAGFEQAAAGYPADQPSGGAAVLMLYLYTPLGSAPIFTALMQFLVVPLLVATGMLMWQLPRLRKLLQGNRLAGQASKRSA